MLKIDPFTENLCKYSKDKLNKSHHFSRTFSKNSSTVAPCQNKNLHRLYLIKPPILKSSGTFRNIERRKKKCSASIHFLRSHLRWGANESLREDSFGALPAKKWPGGGRKTVHCRTLWSHITRRISTVHTDKETPNLSHFCRFWAPYEIKFCGTLQLLFIKSNF